MEETLVKAPNEEPSSEQVYVESVDMSTLCSSIDQVWRSLALQTTVNSRAELVVDSLRYIQPVQFAMQ